MAHFPRQRPTKGAMVTDTAMDPAGQDKQNLKLSLKENPLLTPILFCFN
jgi:hypothetical protein